MRKSQRLLGWNDGCSRVSVLRPSAYALGLSLLVVTARGRTEPQRATEPLSAETQKLEYDSWFGLRRHEPHYMRAGVEIVGLMGLGTIYYWQDPLANSEDWDNPSPGDRARLRAIRFDTNLNTTNHLLHPIAGASVYGIARVNGLSIPVAFAYGVAQSFVWEMALEWREKASVNDLVFTPIGGMPLGEAVYAFGEYLNSAPQGGGFAQRSAAWTLGFPRRIHRAIDGDGAAPIALPADSLGFSSAYAHRFSVGYEGSLLTNDAGNEGAMHSAKLAAEIIAMPRFLEPLAFSRTFWNGNFTETNLRIGFADTGFVEADLQTRATLFGRYMQDLDENGDGHGLMLGVGPALRFQRSKWLGREDQLSTVHLFGPHVELWVRDADLMARFGGEAYLDFASIESLAYPAFAERFGAEGTKSVLQRQGYAYSLGSWARLRGTIAYGIASVGGSIGYGRYETIEGVDRFQERLTRDVHGRESVLETDARFALQLGPVEVSAGIRERRRGSVLGDVSARRWDQALTLGAGLVF